MYIGHENAIGLQGCESLGVVLKQLINLESVEIKIGEYNDIDNEGYARVMEGISHLSNLKSIGIDVGYNSVEELQCVEAMSIGLICL